MIVALASGLATATTSCTLLAPPAATMPMFQVTTPAASVPAPVPVQSAVFAGIVSIITSLVAFMLPVFVYFNDPAMTQIYTPSLRDSVPILFITGAEDTVVVIAAPLVGAVCALSML